MKNILTILALMLILVIFVTPVTANSNDQSATGVIIGNGNTNEVKNDYDYNNYQNQQTAVGNVVDSENVIQIVKSTSVQDITNNNGATDASTNVYLTPIKNPAGLSYTIDTGSITNIPVHSIYMNKMVVIKNEKDDKIQKAGDVYAYSYKSALPVLAYVIPVSETGKAKFDLNCAPEYDYVAEKFTHGNLDVTYDPNDRSNYSWFNFTVPEDGNYALVLDSRVSQYMDGKLTTITSDSVDIAYAIQKVDHVTLPNSNHKMIGERDVYKILDNGMADTTS